MNPPLNFEGWTCPLPLRDYPNVVLGHGGGGKLSSELVQHLFLPAFHNDVLHSLGDSAVLYLRGQRLAFSTNSFVVKPLFFPGGCIGDLAVNGTVNDLAMSGARPLFLSAGFILEEGLPLDQLGQIASRMGQAAREAGVALVTGDTKVVEKGHGDGVYINTSGIGIIPDGVNIAPQRARPGDVVIVSGTLGDHGMAIMSAREGLEFETTIESDCAPLVDLVIAILAVAPNIHVLRDPTRGGAASTLNEIAQAANVGIEIEEACIPARPAVQAACEMLGLDPLYVANEGKLIALVPAAHAEDVLDAMRAHRLGQNAAIIGRVVEDHRGLLVARTPFGATRIVDTLVGEQLSAHLLMATLTLPFASRPLLAVGGELKNRFCLARENTAWLSELNGDMEFTESLVRFEASLSEMQARLGITPEAIACDLHPGYHSARWAARAAEAQGIPLVKVQHHHAHIAAVMAENGLAEPVIGIALDGTGCGTDGAVWGGEVLVCDYHGFTRAAHLKYVPLPGGDAAVRRPYRMALAHLWAAGIPWNDDLPPVQASTPEELRVLRRQLERGLNTVPTSSAGRLFDAISSLVGVRQTVTHEGQAAIELESGAADVTGTPYTFNVAGSDWPLQIDAAPVLRGLIADVRAGVDSRLLSGGFHAALAQALLDAALAVRARTGINKAALSGGVFANLRLLRALCQGLTEHGFDVYTHHQVPANDGGLALGQVAIAHAALA